MSVNDRRDYPIELIIDVQTGERFLWPVTLVNPFTISGRKNGESGNDKVLSHMRLNQHR